MKCTKFKYSLLLLVLMAMLFNMACNSETKGEFKPKLYYTIEGVVVNPAGTAQENVRVEVTDYTMTNSGESKPTDFFGTQTDADGAFSLQVISINKLDKVALKFSKDGNTPNYLNVGVTEGQTVETRAVLQPVGGFQTIDATADTTTTSGGASVTISANTVVDAAGAKVSAARVSVTAIDTTAERSLLPGDLYSTDGGSLKLFSTLGMIEIVVQDGEGNPLYLASGATASISIPVGALAGSNPPSTVGLWYYNGENAKWELEGDLTLNAQGTAYDGTVSHFSIFNAGKTYDATYVKGSVIDQAENKVYGANVSFFTGVFSDNGIWQANYVTGPEGNFPSILLTDLSGVVPDDMHGYIPLPANTELTIYIKYINPDNNEAFEHSEKITTGAAGETTTFEPVVLQLATDAIVTGTVFYDNGQPASGMWFYFRDATNTNTLKLGQVNADGDLVNVNGFTATTDKNIPVPKETEGLVFISSGPPDASIPIVSWFVNGNGVLDFAAGSDTMKKFTTGIAGETYNFEITLHAQGSAGPVVVDNAYVNGIAKLEDGSFAPEGSLIFFNTTVLGNPVIYRAQVGANGVFPDPNGELPTVLINGEYYVELATEKTYTVSIYDYATDPTNPEELFTYSYTSVKKDLTDYVTIGPNTTVSGRVYYDGKLGADLLVTFTKVDAVTECITDTNDPDYDPECKVDVPVTAITDATGAYSVALEINTKYTVTVSTHDGSTPLDTLKTFLYTSNTDASDSEPPPITIGAAYVPAATVSGTVVYDGALGADLLVTFTKTTQSIGDEPVYAYTDVKGKYSDDLEPATQYTVTVSEHDAVGNATTQLYPSADFPAPGGALLFTSSDIDSNITGEEDVLNIQIGAGLKTNFPYTPFLPDGSAGVGGTLMNADGTPAAVGTLFYFLPEGGNPQFDAVWAIVNDANGTYFAADATFAATEYPVALTPESVYTVSTFSFVDFSSAEINSGFTTGGAGIVQTVSLTIPAEGEVPSDDAYATGTLMNADGTPAAVGTLFYFLIEGGNPQFDAIWAIVNDADGKYYAADATFASTGDPVPLAPESVYTVSTFSFVDFSSTEINTGFTSGGAGVVQTVSLAIPAEGEVPSDDAYATGYLLNANGTPAAVGTLFYFLPEGGNPQFDAIWAIVNDADGKYYAADATFASTGDPVPLAPESVYTVNTFSFVDFSSTEINAGFTSGGAGIVKTLLLTIP